MYLSYSWSVFGDSGRPCLFLLVFLNCSATSLRVVLLLSAEELSGSIQVPDSMENSICLRALSARAIVENVPPDRLLPVGSVYRIRILPERS